MERLRQSDLINIVEYEKVRDSRRNELIAYKKDRRVQLGPEISITFENRVTLTFQIQEMMRAEKMIRDEQVQEELDIYNTLIPQAGELSATLFIEITQEEDIRQRLHKFLGLTDGNSLWLELDGQRTYAQFEQGRSQEDRISSVHYLRFELGEAGSSALKAASQAAMVIDQQGYSHRSELSAAMRQSLAGDLN